MKLRNCFVLFVCCCCVLFAQSCSNKGVKGKKRLYIVAIDPTWFPLDTRGFQKRIQGFSNELLSLVSREEKFFFDIEIESRMALESGLAIGRCDLALSTITPSLSSRSQYDLSDAYLFTGPVLVVAKKSNRNSLDDMKHLLLGAQADVNLSFILENYSSILWRKYVNLGRAFGDLEQRKLDGLICAALPAHSYCQNFYSGKFKVVTNPLSNDGLRMIAIKGKYPKVIEIFNNVLQKLKDSGEYDKLLARWGLDTTLASNGDINE